MARVAFVATLVSVTLAPGIGFPCGSLTVPLMPDVPVWPHTAVAQSSMHKTTDRVPQKRASNFFIVNSFVHRNGEWNQRRRGCFENARPCRQIAVHDFRLCSKHFGQPCSAAGDHCYGDSIRSAADSVKKVLLNSLSNRLNWPRECRAAIQEY